MSGLDRLPLIGLLSDENEDGSAVGGRTEASWCAVRDVPVPRSTAPLLLLALVACGPAALLLPRRLRRS